MQTSLSSYSNEHYYAFIKALPEKEQKALSLTCKRFYRIYRLMSKEIPSFLNCLKKNRSFFNEQHYRFLMDGKLHVALQVTPFYMTSERQVFQNTEFPCFIGADHIDHINHFVWPYYKLNGKISSLNNWAFANQNLIKSIQAIFENLLKYLIDPQNSIPQELFIEKLNLYEFGQNAKELLLKSTLHSMEAHFKDLMAKGSPDISEEYVFKTPFGKITLLTRFKDEPIKFKTYYGYSIFPGISKKIKSSQAYFSTKLNDNLALTGKIELPLYTSEIILKIKEIVEKLLLAEEESDFTDEALYDTEEDESDLTEISSSDI